MIYTYFRVTEYIENVINEVNENGGWTVIGWYKRGMIDDTSNNQDTNKRIGDATANEWQVESGMIIYHVCHILPTNCRGLETNHLGQHMQALK